MKFKDQYGKTHNRLISAYLSDIINFLKGNVKTSPFAKDTIEDQDDTIDDTEPSDEIGGVL